MTMTVTPEAIAAALNGGRPAEAVLLLEAWVEQHPADADAWFNLGWARRQLLRHAEARAAYRQALANGISEPEQVHLNLAALESDVCHDAAAARASLQAALAIRPDFVLAWQNLGQLEEDVGNPAAARAAYAAAAAHAPGLGRPVARLAALDVFEGRPADALARVEQAGAEARSHDDLVELSFAAANALDALGRYDEAFDQASLANQLQRQTSGLPHSPREIEAQVNALIALFPAGLPPSPVPVAGIRPVFICGLFRSGSTLLESLLSQRLGIAMGGELAFTPMFMSQHGSSITPATRDAMAAQFAAGYAEFAQSVLAGATCFTDKRMDNFLFLGLIKRAFPDALILHCQRRPIDNFLSMFFLPFADNLSYANDFDDMLHYYRQYRRLMAHWQQQFGADILPVGYEQLVSDPDGALATVQQRLGLAPAPAVRADDLIIRTASAWQVRAPVHGRSAGRWRHYAAHIGELAAALAAEFPEFA